MASPLDGAEYILREVPDSRRDWMKLQKLLYYSQAWSLVWDSRPLFADAIEAWRNGPVIPSIYRAQRHESASLKGAVDSLDATAVETLRAVIEAFGDKSGEWLSNLAHRERPWIDARQGLPDDARGNGEISHAAMREWYGKQPVPKKQFPVAYLRGLDLMVQTPRDELELLTSGQSVSADAYLNWLENGDSWPE